MQDGNPLDRIVYSALIVLMIGILARRSFKWNDFLRRNLALTMFLSFGLLSMMWSDFPFVALKRWFRDLGDYLAVLVLLTDSQPLEAVRTALRRLCYLLVPLSIVMIKYFPVEAIHYEYWSGLPEYVGVATSKNTLGAICLISGIVFFWDITTTWRNRRTREGKKTLIINCAFFAMSIWLLRLSDSATSRVCLLLGCLVIVVANIRSGKRYQGFLKFLMPASFLAYVVMTCFFSMNAQFASLLGRNSNLTGRTEIWGVLLSVGTNPIVGTGYESFWLGSRLQFVWERSGGINEAHNGYLDVYLTLGSIGLVLLLAILFSGYRSVCRRLDSGSDLATFGSALWTIALFYNVTEAAFINGLLWMTFLMGTVLVAQPAKVGARMRHGKPRLNDPLPATSGWGDVEEPVAHSFTRP